MTREYTTSQNYKVCSDKKNRIKDWNLSLKILWLSSGHENDLIENTVSEKEVR